MADPPFASFAQNGEDVVLWRALGRVERGRYIDVGAHHPSTDSVTRAFYDRGWRGITVEPVPTMAELLRQERPGDLVIEAAITAGPETSATLHEVADTGLSTLDDAIGEAHRSDGHAVRDLSVPTRTLNDVLQEAGWVGDDIHFLSVDAEGSEAGVLQSIDLQKWRPWILVIESTAPNSTRPSHEDWEDVVRSSGYRFCLFDGLSRFYVADERQAELGDALTAPANVGDNYTTWRHREMAQALEEAEVLRRAAITQSIQWRAVALERWSERMEDASYAAERVTAEVSRLHEEIVALQGTLSWRVTRPLRAIRERLPRNTDDA
jgi:FkbM family methyltransferase